MPTRPSPTLRQFARHLRLNQTNCELILWQKLRSRQLANLKFRRQYPYPPYILDFFCIEQKLAIELDGGHHYDATQTAYDQRRTRYLNQQGIHVLRFSNLDILHNLAGVLEHILLTPAAASAQTPTPHPGPAKSPSAPPSAHQSAPRRKTGTRQTASCSAPSVPSRIPLPGQRFYPAD